MLEPLFLGGQGPERNHKQGWHALEGGRHASSVSLAGPRVPR